MLEKFSNYSLKKFLFGPLKVTSLFVSLCVLLWDNVLIPNCMC